jgi:signal transduction histidine kinase
MSATATATATEARTTQQLTRAQELASIISAYNEVTEQLRLSHEGLERQVRKLREELADKSARLARSERLAALGQMAAGLAHEIRNPLGGIQLFASLLEKDLGHLPEQQALAQKISRGVCALDGLVNDILDFAGEIRLQLSQVNLVELAAQSLELLAPVAREYQARVATDLPERIPVVADANQLRSALMNLLRNAFEASGVAGEISVSAGREAATNTACLRITDSGQGVPPEHMDKIFNPFFTTKETGTGLGLSMVHRIVDAHGGRIKVENLPGGGACFQIELPCEARTARQPAPMEAAN